MPSSAPTTPPPISMTAGGKPWEPSNDRPRPPAPGDNRADEAQPTLSLAALCHRLGYLADRGGLGDRALFHAREGAVRLQDQPMGRLVADEPWRLCRAG